MTWELHLGDCLDVLPTLKGIDAVISDPPYPDILKAFQVTPIDFLDAFTCRQLVFWSAVEPFPLTWSAVHIWHKPNGNSSQHYERIFERNGSRVCRVFRVAAILPNYVQFRDECVDHPTQKPLKLLNELIERYTSPGDTVFDPFAGSGTTGVACIKRGRNFIGCEIDPHYHAIAVRRLEDAAAQLPLFSEMEMQP